MIKSMSLPAYFADMQREIENYAKEYGLDYFDTIFEVLDYQRMNEVAAYGGFPTRYPHWRFGMDFEGLAKGYEYGLSKIYEMVINNDPCYAYLLEGNSSVDQKMVMAHVYGHCDFFKNNFYFSRHQPANDRRHGQSRHAHPPAHRASGYRQGRDVHRSSVCRSITSSIRTRLTSSGDRRRARRRRIRRRPTRRAKVPKLRAKSYMDKFINPPDFIEKQQQKMEKEKEKEKKFPERPERDVLLFFASMRRSSVGSATSSR